MPDSGVKVTSIAESGLSAGHTVRASGLFVGGGCHPQFQERAVDPSGRVVVLVYTGNMDNSLKSYPPTWEGVILLACRKCQKKLKGAPGMRALAKLKKTIKYHNKQHADAALHLINVPCMDLCPKGGVSVCLPQTQAPKLSILRNEGEVDELYGRE